MTMAHYAEVVGVMAHLHNFCINECLSFGLTAVPYDDNDLAFESDVVNEHEEAAELQAVSNIAPQMLSYMREYLVWKIYNEMNIRRPGQSSVLQH